MPLRDHFRPPLDRITSWEGVHGGWPMVIVQHLVRALPPEFVASPRVHHGAQIEIDMATYEAVETGGLCPVEPDGGGLATAVWTETRPTISVVTDLPDTDEYEVLVYDANRGRRLVAAVAIVGPANKDRPDHRRAFVSKCAALIQSRVSVAVVDLVTTRQINLFRDLAEVLGHPAPAGESPPTYAAAARIRSDGRSWRLEAWEHSRTLGSRLPTLPLWLSDTRVVPLDLETTYEETCRTLRIP